MAAAMPLAGRRLTTPVAAAGAASARAARRRSRELHGLLLRAARFELGRAPRRARRTCAARSSTTSRMQAADDALVAIMGKLDDFRGDSRFTTWAYKFALLEAAVRVRRRAWQGREVPLEPEAWARSPTRGAAPDSDAETRRAARGRPRRDRDAT